MLMGASNFSSRNVHVR